MPSHLLGLNTPQSLGGVINLPYPYFVILKKENNQLEDFDAFYKIEDPWNVSNSFRELARVKKFSEIFKNAKFLDGLDIGCGEGHFTSTFDFVENLSAIDISEVALGRARIFYPDINFVKADLRNLSELDFGKFDFISCLETIYYITGEEERKRALRQIKSKGKDNCVYCFSVVTIGENEHRKYFTYNEAVTFFASEFNIINEFPISLVSRNLNFPQRVKHKIKRTLLGNSYTFASYLSELNSAMPQSAYQTVFILTKKS